MKKKIGNVILAVALVAAAIVVPNIVNNEFASEADVVESDINPFELAMNWRPASFDTANISSITTAIPVNAQPGEYTVLLALFEDDHDGQTMDDRADSNTQYFAYEHINCDNQIATGQYVNNIDLDFTELSYYVDGTVFEDDSRFEYARVEDGEYYLGYIVVRGDVDEADILAASQDTQVLFFEEPITVANSAEYPTEEAEDKSVIITIDSEDSSILKESTGLYTITPDYDYISNVLSNGITMQGYTAMTGWSEEDSYIDCDGEYIESFRMICNDPEKDIFYRSYIEDLGWTAWARNGEISGSVGLDRYISQMQIYVSYAGDTIPTEDELPFKNLIAGIDYSGYTEYGESDEFISGDIIGDMEDMGALLEFTVTTSIEDLSITTDSVIMNEDEMDQEIVSEDGMIGDMSIGESILAYSMELEGAASDYYSIYYRAYMDDDTWSDWTYDGALVKIGDGESAIVGAQVILESAADTIQY